MIESRDVLNRVPWKADEVVAARTCSAFAFATAVWFFVSPWAYYVSAGSGDWNCWFAGALMILFAGARMLQPRRNIGLSWANMLLGIWVFFSPWIFGYSHITSRLVNSLSVGVVVFSLSILSAHFTRELRKARPQ